jgi:large subunit ribosomal protein L31
VHEHGADVCFRDHTTAHTSEDNDPPRAMKKDIHPNYRIVVFKDVSSNTSYITRSCVRTNDTIKWEDGNEYPLYKINVSSSSHPFYTGQKVLVDTAGRVEKFRNRYNRGVAKP